MTTLKNCPFCGSDSLREEVETEFMGNKVYRVSCCRCLTKGPRTISNKAKARSMWNKRAPKAKKVKPDNDRGHYWICDVCALERGGKCEGRGTTAMTGTCPYCTSAEVTLIPIVDYNWPDGTKAIFD
jgi:Lar family restriction alleviation protein